LTFIVSISSVVLAGELAGLFDRQPFQCFVDILVALEHTGQTVENPVDLDFPVYFFWSICPENGILRYNSLISALCGGKAVARYI
jgi:hypothetical protein